MGKIVKSPVNKLAWKKSKPKKLFCPSTSLWAEQLLGFQAESRLPTYGQVKLRIGFEISFIKIELFFTRNALIFRIFPYLSLMIPGLKLGSLAFSNS